MPSIGGQQTTGHSREFHNTRSMHRQYPPDGIHVGTSIQSQLEKNSKYMCDASLKQIIKSVSLFKIICDSCILWW